MLWDMETGRSFRKLAVRKSDLFDVAFSPNKEPKLLASAGEDGKIILWDTATQRPYGEPLKGHLNLITDVAFSPDGKTLASSSIDWTILLWDVETQQQLGEPLLGHVFYPMSVAFAPPDGKLLISGGCGKAGGVFETCTAGEIRFWDVDTGQSLGPPLAAHSGSVSSLAFSPDGKTLASGGDDHNILLWDVAERRPLGPPLSGHKLEVYSVAFSPDGKLLASGSRDTRVILWDVKSRTQLGLPLTGHVDTVTRVVFSPDSRQVASASGDSTVMIWDVATGQLMISFDSHSEWISSVDFSPDGKILASGGDDGTIQMWDIGRTSWQEDACNIVGRNLTRAEWALYLPGQTPRKTCEQWLLEPETPSAPELAVADLP
jgi:WD40 repeat protein